MIIFCRMSQMLHDASEIVFVFSDEGQIWVVSLPVNGKSVLFINGFSSY